MHLSVSQNQIISRKMQGNSHFQYQNGANGSLRVSGNDFNCIQNTGEASSLPAIREPIPSYQNPHDAETMEAFAGFVAQLLQQQNNHMFMGTPSPGQNHDQSESQSFHTQASNGATINSRMTFIGNATTDCHSTSYGMTNQTVSVASSVPSLSVQYQTHFPQNASQQLVQSASQYQQSQNMVQKQCSVEHQPDTKNHQKFLDAMQTQEYQFQQEILFNQHQLQLPKPHHMGIMPRSNAENSKTTTTSCSIKEPIPECASFITDKKEDLFTGLITFPQKLMEMLAASEKASSAPSSSPEAVVYEAVAWLSHGEAFVIKDATLLTEQVLPKFFPPERQRGKAKATVKFSSFLRKLHRWGIKQVSRGVNIGAFYNPLFQRDQPHLCLQMKCQRTGGSSRIAELNSTSKNANYNKISASKPSLSTVEREQSTGKHNFETLKRVSPESPGSNETLNNIDQNSCDQTLAINKVVHETKDFVHPTDSRKRRADFEEPIPKKTTSSTGISYAEAKKCKKEYQNNRDRSSQNSFIENVRTEKTTSGCQQNPVRFKAAIKMLKALLSQGAALEKTKKPIPMIGVLRETQYRLQEQERHLLDALEMNQSCQTVLQLCAQVIAKNCDKNRHVPKKQRIGRDKKHSISYSVPVNYAQS